ncbi:Protein-tyrosine phosphatase [Ancylostoma caninum]|uniref:Protein-tyrosine phosphatase n=1 Tax=Ancylostoma caninum TaxID=29170 RepID=A0A368GP37_ANCCA|nr:Protein-tyrosine phosphatase [Ancylostoma caninum]
MCDGVYVSSGFSSKRRGSRWPSRERPTRRPSQEKLSREGTHEEENKQSRGVELPTDAQRAAFERFAREVFAMGIDGLLREFKDCLRPYVASPYKREAFDLHMDKNRYRDVTCNDYTRVVLNDGKGSDYIHANYIKGAPLVCNFICTQGPLPETIIDFWRMVWMEKVSHIIMLCGVKEGGKVKCEQYWPDENGEKMTLEDFLIKTMKVNNSDPHVTRTTIQLQQGSERHYLKHHRWKTWPDRNVPKSLLAVFRILHQVRNSKSPIVVHCSAGIGRTGSLVAIEMGLQCLLAGTTLDLLKICKRLRDQRMHSVQVEIQYVYVAEALCEYGRAMKYIENQRLLNVRAPFVSNSST